MVFVSFVEVVWSIAFGTTIVTTTTTPIATVTIVRCQLLQFGSGFAVDRRRRGSRQPSACGGDGTGHRRGGCHFCLCAAAYYELRYVTSRSGSPSFTIDVDKQCNHCNLRERTNEKKKKTTTTTTKVSVGGDDNDNLE